MGQLQVQLDRIRRRWVLILVITLVAGAGALGASLVQGKSYTGKAALTIQSADRSPEQDSVLAQGYADYFNQPSTQEVLRQKAGVDGQVTFFARIAAASPIVYIEATADQSDVAADAATKMAVTFRDDVRNNLAGGVLDDLRNQLNGTLARLGSLPPADAAQRGALAGTAGDLQKRINDLQADSQSNQLQDLQLSAGVAENPTDAARNTGVALLGGLIVGCLAALALGRFEGRIADSSEVNDRLGLDTLAVVAGRRDRTATAEEQRTRRLRALINLVGSTDIPSPGALAVTSARPSRAKSEVAVSIAALRALQGQTTLLIQADLGQATPPGELAGRPGVADFLAGQLGTRLDGKVFDNGHGLLVSPPGSPNHATYELFSRQQLSALLRQGTALADLVVIDAPAVVDSAEAQIVCSVADRTVMVVEEGETRSSEAITAMEALRGAHASMVGAVIVQNSAHFGDIGLLASEQWRDAQVPARPIRPGGAPGAAPPPPPGPMGPGPTGPGPSSRPRSGPPRSPGPAAPTDAEQNPRTQPISHAQLQSAVAAAPRPGAARSATKAANGASLSSDGAEKKGAGEPKGASAPKSAAAPKGTAAPTGAGQPTGQPTSAGDPKGGAQPKGTGQPAGTATRGTPAGSALPAGKDGRGAAEPQGNPSSRGTPPPLPPQGSGPAAVGGTSSASKGTAKKIGSVKVPGTARSGTSSDGGTRAGGGSDRSAPAPGGTGSARPSPRPRPAPSAPSPQVRSPEQGGSSDDGAKGGSSGPDVAAPTVSMRSRK